MAFNGDAISTSIICQTYPPTWLLLLLPRATSVRVFGLVEDLSPGMRHM